MIGVKVSPKNGIDKTLKIFREKIKDSKVLEIYKSKRYFVSKSEKKREARRKAQRIQKFREKENTFLN